MKRENDPPIAIQQHIYRLYLRNIRVGSKSISALSDTSEIFVQH